MNNDNQSLILEIGWLYSLKGLIKLRDRDPDYGWNITISHVNDVEKYQHTVKYLGYVRRRDFNAKIFYKYIFETKMSNAKFQLTKQQVEQAIRYVKDMDHYPVKDIDDFYVI